MKIEDLKNEDIVRDNATEKTYKYLGKNVVKGMMCYFTKGSDGSISFWHKSEIEQFEIILSPSSLEYKYFFIQFCG